MYIRLSIYSYIYIYIYIYIYTHIYVCVYVCTQAPTHMWVCNCTAVSMWDIHVHMCVFVCVHMWNGEEGGKERERERERESILTSGQAVSVLTLERHVPGRVATKVPIFKSLVSLDAENPHSRSGNSTPDLLLLKRMPKLLGQQGGWKERERKDEQSRIPSIYVSFDKHNQIFFQYHTHLYIHTK